MAAEDYIPEPYGLSVNDWHDSDGQYHGPTNIDEEREYIQMLHDGDCVKPVVLRISKKTRQTFWGCSDFPAHRWAHKRV